MVYCIQSLVCVCATVCVSRMFFFLSKYCWESLLLDFCICFCFRNSSCCCCGCCFSFHYIFAATAVFVVVAEVQYEIVVLALKYFFLQQFACLIQQIITFTTHTVLKKTSRSTNKMLLYDTLQFNLDHMQSFYW